MQRTPVQVRVGNDKPCYLASMQLSWIGSALPSKSIANSFGWHVATFTRVELGKYKRTVSCLVERRFFESVFELVLFLVLAGTDQSVESMPLWLSLATSPGRSATTMLSRHRRCVSKGVSIKPHGQTRQETDKIRIARPSNDRVSFRPIAIILTVHGQDHN